MAAKIVGLRVYPDWNDIQDQINEIIASSIDPGRKVEFMDGCSMVRLTGDFSKSEISMIHGVMKNADGE